MKLEAISVENFRSLKKVEDIPIHKLTILIGENDAGKSSLVDILDIALNKKLPHPEDFSIETFVDSTSGEVKTKAASKIEITLKFSLDSEDQIPSNFLTGNNQLIYKVICSNGTSSTYCRGQVYEDSRFNTFTSLKAQEKDAFLKSLGIEVPGRLNDEKRKELLESYLNNNQISTQEGWVEIKNELINFMPRFEKYSSADYKNPESLVHKTLYAIVEASLYEKSGEGEDRKLRKSLSDLELEIKQNLDTKVKELTDFVSRYNPEIQDIEVYPQIDFAKGFQAGKLYLKDTSGASYSIERKGEGTKKRLFLSILDWERKVLIEQDTRPVIRGYDEPDTNLHYEAQRRMYYSLKDITHKENSQIQAIICTHSLTMIDRAPAKSINLLKKDSFGNTSVHFLSSSNDAEVEMFLAEMTSTMGIPNSSVFYDRCFVFVEGITEANSLPIFYKTVHGTTLPEDGIRLINIEGCGGWKNYIKLLGINKKDLVIFLLDQDCNNASSSSDLTVETLQDFGFDDNFIQDKIVFIGTKEFEDSFNTDVILGILNTHWPKHTKEDWLAQDIDNLRTQEKFSEELLKAVRIQSRMKKGDSITKESFAIKLAQDCTKDHIPEALITLFEKARQVAGVKQFSTQEVTSLLPDSTISNTN